ncbi:MAG: SurA N-terminal domain-containing protein [Elusimicrobia bacterium]|nr:SurA N-terminal domain-containing protein [Elusimicrobiota bacterium]
MLKAIRKNTKVFLWFAVSIFILATFVGLGSYFFTRTSNVVAKVNGQNISYEEFNAVFLQRLDNYRNMYHIDINEEIANNLKKMVITDLISKKLQLQEAKKMKLKVTNEELSSYIQKFPYFQKDGQFNQQNYLNILKMQLHVTPAVFEKEVRENLIISHLQEKVSAGVTVTDKEVEDELAKRLKDKKPALKPEDLPKEKENIKQTLWPQKRKQLFDDWYKQREASAKIENNLAQMEKQMGGSSQSEPEQ